MRIILAIFIMALCQAVAVADNKSPNPQPGIEETIRLQIEAFKKDDAQTAFSLATPFIQRRYGTPDTFMAVVAFAYPQVYRPQSYRFTERVDRTSHAVTWRHLQTN